MRQLERLFGFTVLCGLLLAASGTWAQRVEILDTALQGRIDRIAAQVLEQTGVPSASVAVVKGGKLDYTQAYGKARLDSTSRRHAGDALLHRVDFKAIHCRGDSAAAGGGQASLDDAVGKYVPGLTRGDEVTIRQILSHTSGYQDYWPEDYVMTTMMHDETAQQIIDTWGKKPLDFEPGTQWQYSNTNYVIAGRIVEQVTGRPYMEFLTARIFHPLGMQSVWNSDETKLTQADATPYYRNALGPLAPIAQGGPGLDVRCG